MRKKVTLRVAAMGLAAALSACSKYESAALPFDNNCSGQAGIYLPDYCAEYTSGSW